jgi:hypothetical protein
VGLIEWGHIHGLAYINVEKLSMFLCVQN